MKLKRITDEGIRIAIKKAHRKKPGILLPVKDIYDSITQAQLEACEKEATDKVNETLSLVEGYTEMAVREIFEEIAARFDNEPTHTTFVKKQSVEECYVIPVKDYLAYKQSTLKKYGGER